MKIKYDKKADALYIKVKKGVIKKTSRISDFVNIDLDKNGDLIGMEILNFSLKSNFGKNIKSPFSVPVSILS